LVAYLASNPDIQRTETLMVLEIIDDWRRRVMPPASPA
jgi:Lrp/AsnC family transcriptional regulator for asnA, asnC and gidA